MIDFIVSEKPLDDAERDRIRMAWRGRLRNPFGWLAERHVHRLKVRKMETDWLANLVCVVPKRQFVSWMSRRG